MDVPTFLPPETKYEIRMWIWSAFIDSLLRHCSLHRVKDYVRDICFVSLWPSVFIVRLEFTLPCQGKISRVLKDLGYRGTDSEVRRSSLEPILRSELHLVFTQPDN